MALLKNNPEVNNTIDKLIKDNHATITAALTKHFGIENLEQIENIVSKSFNDAKNSWIESSVPNDPKNIVWKFVTENSSDLFCKKVTKNKKISIDSKNYEFENLNFPNEAEAYENNVTMLFACCNPLIPANLKVPLTLKIFGGFTTSYISRLLGKNQNSLSYEIILIKQLALDKKIDFKLPENKDQFNSQLANIIGVLYEIFSLGYKNGDKKLKVIPELCYCALNTASMLTSFNQTNTPETKALLSLMLLKGSRLNSMLDDKGNLLTLKEQDRNLWNKEMIKDGIHNLYKSANGKNVTKIHLEAGIAAIHSTSKNYESTNWKQIVSLYDNYLKLNYSPFTELERSIAISKYLGPKEGLKSINRISNLESLKQCELLYSTLGNLNLEIHKYDNALESYKKSLDLAQSSNFKSFLLSKIKICDQRIKMSKRYQYGLSF